jgi:hypothetical protein
MPTEFTWGRDSIDTTMNLVRTLMHTGDKSTRFDQALSVLLAYFVKGNESFVSPTYRGSVLLVSQILAFGGGITTSDKHAILSKLPLLLFTNPADPRIFATFEQIGRLRRPTFATISERVDKLERQLYHQNIKDADTRCRKHTNRTCDRDVECDWHPSTSYTPSACLSKIEQLTGKRHLAPAVALLNTIMLLPANNHYLWYNTADDQVNSILGIQQKRHPDSSVWYIPTRWKEGAQQQPLVWHVSTNRLELGSRLMSQIEHHVPLFDTVIWKGILHNHREDWAHAGVFVLSKRSPTRLVLTRFEPHGGVTNLYDAVALDVELVRFCRETLSKLLSAVVEYQPPSLTCPTEGPQSVQMDGTERTITLLKGNANADGVYKEKPFDEFEVGGYCAAWTTLLMHLQLVAPRASMADLYRLTTRYTPEETRTLIRNYAGLLVEHSRKSPNFSTIRRWDTSLRSNTSSKRKHDADPPPSHKKIKLEPTTFVSDSPV